MTAPVLQRESRGRGTGHVTKRGREESCCSKFMGWCGRFIWQGGILGGVAIFPNILCLCCFNASFCATALNVHYTI